MRPTHPDEAPGFAVPRALGVWLACGSVLTLACPPLASAQTFLGSAPLWLVGLPAVALALILSARRIPLRGS